MARAGFVACASLVLALSFASVSHATIVEKLSVEEMARRAVTIVVAKADRLSTAPGSGTVAQMDVSRVLKGSPASNMVVKTPMSVVSGEVRGPMGGPVINDGEECLLFLDRKGMIIGGWQGKITLKNGVAVQGGDSLARLEYRIDKTLGRLSGAEIRSTAVGTEGKMVPLAEADVAFASRLSRAPRASSNAVQPAATRFFDNFSDGNASGPWEVYRNPSASAYDWGCVNSRSSWGSDDYSVYCAGSAGPMSNYPGNMEAYMDSRAISVVKTAPAYLDFDLWVDTEPGMDGLICWVTGDNWKHAYTLIASGDSDGWGHVHQSLSKFPIGGGKYVDLRTNGSVKVGMMFVSNGSNPAAYEGVYVDNVAVTDQAVSLSSISPPSQPAGIGAPLELYGSGFGTEQPGLVSYFWQFQTDGSDVWEQAVFDLTPTLWTSTHVTSHVPIGDWTEYGYPASASSGPVRLGSGVSGVFSNYKLLVVPFGIDGTNWGTRGDPVTVDYYVNPRGVPARASQIQSGAAVWSDKSDLFEFRYAGASTLVHDSGTDITANGVNDMIFSTDLPDGVIAWSVPVNETPREQDIEFNLDYDWGDAASDDTLMDVQGITTHELGHWLALRDLYGPEMDTSKMMYGYGDEEVAKRDLAGGDIDGLRWIYDGHDPHSRAAERVAGADRFAVAVTTARKAYPGWTGVTDVIVASGEDRAMADALAAAGLAGALDAPILTTKAGELPSSTRNAIREMAPVNVHVVGGTGSVSGAVYNALNVANGTGTMKRFSGADRYSCAARVAARIKEIEGTSTVAFLVNGSNPAYFTDALAISPIAFQRKIPVLLVDGAKRTLPSATRAALTSLGCSEVVAAGNLAAVPASVTAQVEAMFPGTTSRIANSSSRYTRSSLIADYALSTGWVNPTNTFVGVANKLPDALTGGAAVGHKGGVLLYCNTTAMNSAYQWMSDHTEHIDGCWVFGGTASVPEPVRTFVETRIQ